MGETLRIAHDVFEKSARKKDREERTKKLEVYNRERVRRRSFQLASQSTEDEEDPEEANKAALAHAAASAKERKTHRERTCCIL